MGLGGIQSGIRTSDLGAIAAGFVESGKEAKTIQQVPTTLRNEIPEDASESAGAAKLAAKQSKVSKPLAQRKVAKADKKPAVLRPIEEIKDSANKFSKKNPEFQNKEATLIKLREDLKGKSKQEVLEILQRSYPDVTLADLALGFLIENTDTDDEKKLLQEIQKEFQAEHARDIQIGQNYREVALKIEAKGGGTAQSARDVCRDLLNNTREPNALFDELTSKYTLKSLQQLIKSLHHELGTQTKASSIPRPELQALIGEIRKLQNISSVFAYFQSRFKLVEKLYRKLQNTHGEVS